MICEEYGIRSTGGERIDLTFAGQVADMDKEARRGFAAPFDDVNLLFIDMIGAPIPASLWEPDERAVFGLDDRKD